MLQLYNIIGNKPQITNMISRENLFL